MTHACCLDVCSDVYKELFVGFGIFATNEDVERDLSALQRFQVLGWARVSFLWQSTQNAQIISYLSSQL
jgi:hypothetical protein